MGNTVKYEQDGQVAIVALNRPDALNGFTTELCEELLAALETAGRDDAIRAVVLTGEGRAFSAGADLKQGFDGERTTQGKLLYEYRPALATMAQMPKPVIAAVPGFAAGVGLSFALHADLLIMAEESFILSPSTTISLVPDGGANWLLVRQLGYRARVSTQHRIRAYRRRTLCRTGHRQSNGTRRCIARIGRRMGKGVV